MYKRQAWETALTLTLVDFNSKVSCPDGVLAKFSTERLKFTSEFSATLLIPELVVNVKFVASSPTPSK